MRKIFSALPIILTLGALVTLHLTLGASALSPNQTGPKTESQLAQISVPGSVVPENQVNLHFQISGKLVSLPFKVGDRVEEGQTIAALDSSQAQEAVGTAQSNLKSAQAALNLVLDNIHLYQYGNGGFDNVGSSNETQTQKTQREEAQAAVNAAQDALNSAEQTLSEYSLVAPFSGVVTHEDVVSSGVNVTTTTTFTLSDPSSAVFQAEVDDFDISNVRVGTPTWVKLNGAKADSLYGQVSKIYPDATTAANGDKVYQVDIASGGLTKVYLGESGTALIQASSSTGATIVPSWTILNHQYLWVMADHRPQLKKVTIGDSQNGQTQIKAGLSPNDKIITTPKSIITEEYKLL